MVSRGKESLNIELDLIKIFKQHKILYRKFQKQNNKIATLKDTLDIDKNLDNGDKKSIKEPSQ
jgi:hypothetical protein